MDRNDHMTAISLHTARLFSTQHSVERIQSHLPQNSVLKAKHQEKLFVKCLDWVRASLICPHPRPDFVLTTAEVLLDGGLELL